VKTVGIDLAARDENTAMCVIDWSAREARVQVPTVGHDDDALLAAISESDRAGIDAPFGWPQAFADAVTAHQARKAWPGSEKELRALAEDRVRYRNRLAYRLTDLAVIDDPKLAVRPLSVSTDRIGVTTFRCALLLDRLANEKGLEVDRSGRTGTVAEVYPAAALPDAARASGACVVEINLESTPLSARADYSLRGRAAALLPALVAAA
jgi:predicted nuclease with RNAse H fold